MSVDRDRALTETTTCIFPFCFRSTMFANPASYATKIAHNLSYHIDIENTLKLAKVHPESLLYEIEIIAPQGYRVRGTVLKILAAAGEFYKNIGLVELLRPCFRNDADFIQQLSEQFPEGWEIETQQRMSPLINAIKTCFAELANTEISEEDSFSELAKKPFIINLKKALIPNSNHIVTSGYIYSPDIFAIFFRIWKESEALLGDLESPRSKAAFLIYGVLQAHLQRMDLEVYKAGISRVLTSEYKPKRLRFIEGEALPRGFSNLGCGGWLDYHKKQPYHSMLQRIEHGIWLAETYINQKQEMMFQLLNHKKTEPRPSGSCAW